MNWVLQDVSFSTRFLRTAGISLCMLGLLVLLPAVSHAVPINHGTFPADTVVYVDVTEDTTTGDSQPLFGPPNVTGDSMDFDPIGFDASSSEGGAPDVVNGELAFDIVAKTDKFIENIAFSEAGDTGLARGFDPLDDAFTSVVSFIFLDILEVSSGPITQINVGPIEMVFTPSDGDYLLSDDGGGGLTFNSGWTGSAFIDLVPILADHGIIGQATRVSVKLGNTLTAISSAGSSALIAKKDVDGVTITANVPEPATGLLAALGLLALVGASRRNR
jgi:hypothetical protein